MSAVSSADISRSKALYNLHQEEKRHEDRTRQILSELEENSKQTTTARVKLIEKLLDIAVKDEMSRKISEGKIKAQTRLSDEVMRQNAKAVIEDQVKANLQTGKSIYGEHPFLAALGKLVSTDEETARAEVAEAVHRNVAPIIDRSSQQKMMLGGGGEYNNGGVLMGVGSMIATAEKKRKAEMRESISFRGHSNAADRQKRVEAAVAMFKKDIGDLSSLLNLTPVLYKTDIGVAESEIISLRKKVATQRQDEDQLLHERRIQMSLMDAEHAKLTAETEAACQQLVVLRRELESRQTDLREISEASAPKSGQWASSTLKIENDLALAIEEEHQLRVKAEEVRRANNMLKADSKLLAIEVDEGVSELGNMQAELQGILEKLESRISEDKSRLYELRQQQVSDTRQINELRHRMLHRREDVRRQKREARGVINTIFAQIKVEKELQCLLTAISEELQHQAQTMHVQASDHTTALDTKRKELERQNKELGERIRQASVDLTNYIGGAESKAKGVHDAKLTPPQLLNYLDQQTSEYRRQEYDAATSKAQVLSRVHLNTRENDRILRQLGELMVLQEDVRAEGVDITNSTHEDLQFIQDNLYNEVSQRGYQEEKYKQTLHLLHTRLEKKDQGVPVLPLTRNRRLALAERRAKTDAMKRARKEGLAAVEHLRSGRYLDGANENSLIADRRGASSILDASAGRGNLSFGSSENNTSALNKSGGGGQQPQPDAFRSMVIQFIKNEIQPLYDSNQITKRRFVDVVSRVSSWFVGSHRPSKELNESDVAALTRKIQETLTWQDQERLKQRSVSRSTA